MYNILYTINANFFTKHCFFRHSNIYFYSVFIFQQWCYYAVNLKNCQIQTLLSSISTNYAILYNSMYYSISYMILICKIFINI